MIPAVWFGSIHVVSFGDTGRVHAVIANGRITMEEVQVIEHLL
jgi:hypothetical protein